MHTREFCESDFDDDGGDNGKSPLYEKYMEQLTVSIDDEKVSADRYGWIEDIKNKVQHGGIHHIAVLLYW